MTRMCSKTDDVMVYSVYMRVSKLFSRNQKHISWLRLNLIPMTLRHALTAHKRYVCDTMNSKMRSESSRYSHHCAQSIRLCKFGSCVGVAWETKASQAIGENIADGLQQGPEEAVANTLWPGFGDDTLLDFV